MLRPTHPHALAEHTAGSHIAAHVQIGVDRLHIVGGVGVGAGMGGGVGGASRSGASLSMSVSGSRTPCHWVSHSYASKALLSTSNSQTPEGDNEFARRIDEAVAAHFGGATDVLRLALKTLLHAALGPASHLALLLEAEGLTRLLERLSTSPSNTLSVRKRVSSEMLVDQQSLLLLHHQQQLENKHNSQLLRSLSEVSVLSTDSSSSVQSTSSATTITTSNQGIVPPSALQPQSNFHASPVSPLLYNSHELAELAGTSLEYLSNQYPFLSFFASILPSLHSTVSAVFANPLPAQHYLEGHPLIRSKMDPALVTNLHALRICLAHVLRFAVRVIPQPQNQSTNSTTNWTVLGGVIGNWNAAASTGWKRRLGPGGFEVSGPRGLGCGLFGLEEILGRWNPSVPFVVPSNSATTSPPLQFSKPNAAASPNLTHPHQLTMMSLDENDTLSQQQQHQQQQQQQFKHPQQHHHSSQGYLEELEDLRISCQNAWIKRSPLTSGGFLALAPFVDTLERKTRSFKDDYDDEIRLHFPPPITAKQHQQFVCSRTDVAVEYCPLATYLVPESGAESIRMENGETVSEVPEGYVLQTYPATFRINHLHPVVLPRQRMTLNTGNLPNHHLFLSYGTSEERNIWDIMDIPVDLIEDAVTFHLEHFGPTTRPLYSMSIHSSKSLFNVVADMKLRYRTATARSNAMRGKGKERARYDLTTYERALTLLKVLGLFPREGGIIRCKSEYFWQEETFSTILQVLLMSPEQLDEYAEEPCLLDYNCMLHQNLVESTNVPTRETPPPPRPNILPHINMRFRKPLPPRPGVLDAFLAVTHGVLRRRLEMYPTTLQEDLELQQRLSDTYREFKNQLAMEAGIAASKLTVPKAGPATSSNDITGTAATSLESVEDAPEEKRRRKSGDLGQTVAAEMSATAADAVKETEKVDNEIEMQEESMMKVARSDDTLVSTSSAMSVDGTFLHQQQQQQQQQQLQSEQSKQSSPLEFSASIPLASSRTNVSSNPLHQEIHHSATTMTPKTTPTKGFSQSNAFNSPQMSLPTSTATVNPTPNLNPRSTQSIPHQEWFTINRFQAVRFRIQEKRGLAKALTFLDTLIKNQHLLANGHHQQQSDRKPPHQVPSKPALNILDEAGAIQQQIGKLRQEMREVDEADEFDYDEDYSEFGSEGVSDVWTEDFEMA